MHTRLRFPPSTPTVYLTVAKAASVNKEDAEQDPHRNTWRDRYGRPAICSAPGAPSLVRSRLVGRVGALVGTFLRRGRALEVEYADPGAHREDACERRCAGWCSRSHFCRSRCRHCEGTRAEIC